ncbi:MAG: threonine dehydratase [Chloroflexi bacterium]|jgi:threonine dehydratase|nr:MAG: threonine dehydratase [Chloroflexota bacterium]
MNVPTMTDLLKAQELVSKYLPRTPLHYYKRLSTLLGSQVFLKHENHHALGAFKVRGGINIMSNLTEDERRRGVVTASTGNHAQSIAYAGSIFGVETVIVMPEGSNPTKVKSVEALGGKLVFYGGVFDESKLHAENLEKEYGYRYIHSANEPSLISGVGTYAIEILEDLPEVDYIFVPLGGGSGAAGTCIAAKGLKPGVRVVAVQSEKAPAAYLSWKKQSIVTSENATFAEGLATGSGFELTQKILWDLLDEFVLVSDEDIKDAIVTLIDCAHTVAEGAGAAALAGAVKLGDQIRDKNVVIVVSGGNLSLPQLKDIAERIT